MDAYNKKVKELQADAMAAPQKDLAKAAGRDPLAPELDRFLVQLVKARLDKGITQAELAGRLGMRQPAIARVEGRRGNPNLRTLLAIAKALDAELVLKYK